MLSTPNNRMIKNKASEDVSISMTLSDSSKFDDTMTRADSKHSSNSVFLNSQNAEFARYSDSRCTDLVGGWNHPAYDRVIQSVFGSYDHLHMRMGDTTVSRTYRHGQTGRRSGCSESIVVGSRHAQKRTGFLGLHPRRCVNFTLSTIIRNVTRGSAMIGELYGAVRTYSIA